MWPWMLIFTTVLSRSILNMRNPYAITLPLSFINWSKLALTLPLCSCFGYSIPPLLYSIFSLYSQMGRIILCQNSAILYLTRLWIFDSDSNMLLYFSYWKTEHNYHLHPALIFTCAYDISWSCRLSMIAASDSYFTYIFLGGDCDR